MDLILWRHAEAEDGEPDERRQLTKKGVRQAARVGGWLDRQLPGGCRVLCSPADRARQTADALGRKYKIVEALGPGASVVAILEAARWPDAKRSAVIVGHQPTLGQVAAFLLAGEESPWSMSKAALWWFTSKERDGGSNVALRCVIGPDFV